MKQSILKCTLLLALCLCIAGTLFMTVSSAGTAHAATTHAASPAINCPGERVPLGETWYPGDYSFWTACSGKTLYLEYTYTQQFVLYCNNTTIWSTGRQVNGYSAYYTQFQYDGNLVDYITPGSGRKVAIWASNTYNEGAAYMQLQGDANVVIYNSSNKALWASNTNGYC